MRLSVVSTDEISSHQEMIDKDGIITSNRLDSVIACVYRLSRSQSLELIRADRVFVNGKNIQTPTYICKPDDIISVRGHGRFHFISISGETNKGRLKIKYQLYKSYHNTHMQKCRNGGVLCQKVYRLQMEQM